MKKHLSVRRLSVFFTALIFLNTANLVMSFEKHKLTIADVEKIMTAVSNWGRWGNNDQLGALNLITAEKRKEAAALVKSGVPISLSRNVIKEKIGVSEPFEHRMVETGFTPGAVSSSDVYSVQYHGYTQTHLDALCHIFYKGKMYNGFSQLDVSSQGAKTLSVIELKNGIFTRGVLIDMPRVLGLEYLRAGQGIQPEDLDAWEKKTGTKIRSGDAIFIRTGRWARWKAQGEWDIEKGSAGLHVSSMPWFKKRDIAVLASDLAADVMPSGVDGFRLPVHWVTIYSMGVAIIDNCDLEELGNYTTAHKRWDFLLTVAPLAVDGGTGAPVNPTATF